MNPDYGEDSAEVIGSSVKEEDEVEDGARRRHQKAEQTASLSPTAPPATSRVRPSRLLPEVIKPRLASRLPQRLTLAPPPTLRIRLLLPKLPLYLYFICASTVKSSEEICIPWPLCLLAGVIPLACSGLLSVDQVVGVVA